ncbi:hypothetical protein [Brucella anthropi]|uniref:hypothetical protein n=1 Tax=Brucella anthropi TaxID=529 RepID=UPI00244B7E91|nr:hypothetical protein [Brucella anthropi]MDG9791960.1 hypothetical protein [Brucella anthropi]MDH0583405.1 hypothetical protein [Brucella anthropi]MDH0818226.1 hypothetical protein [Brucella anthropi]MDH2085396.1 hypothetical protein [Brucella anthropi]
MDDDLPLEWNSLSPDEKRDVIDLLKRVGIEGVRELLDDPLRTHRAKGSRNQRLP